MPSVLTSVIVVENDTRGVCGIGADFAEDDGNSRAENAADQTTDGHGEKHDGAQFERDPAILHRGKNVHTDRGGHARERSIYKTEKCFFGNDAEFSTRF